MSYYQKIKKSIYLGLVVACVGIVLFNIYQRSTRLSLEQKYEIAMAQCDKYGGEKGELPIITEGVYDNRRSVTTYDIFDRSVLFLTQGLQYVEFNSENVWLSGLNFDSGYPFYKRYRNQFQYYRVMVATSENPLCQPYYKVKNKNLDIFSDLNLPKSKCLAVEGFDEPSRLKAPYEIFVNDHVIDDGFAIEWNDVVVVNRATAETLASFNTFNVCLTGLTDVGGGQGKTCTGGVRARPKCPASYAEDSRVIIDFERRAFKY